MIVVCFKVYLRQVSSYSILAYLITAMLCEGTIMSYCVYIYTFCFNGFNHVTWFNMCRIMKDYRCLIKTIKTEDIMRKHTVT